ncbi:MAG: phytanoyl-CoA dioxygenase family protein [Rhodospirillaceae bacterium]
MTEQWVTEFWSNGFGVIRNVFGEDEVAALREACEAPAIVREQLQRRSAEKVTHVMEATVRSPRFADVAVDDRLTEPLSRLIGNDIQLLHSKLTSKPLKAERGYFPWHQDLPFWVHTNTDLVAACIAIDPLTEENGCLRMIPGSHKWGLLDHTSEGFFAGHCEALAQVMDATAQAVPLVLAPGDVSFHHCLTIHGSNENVAGRPRRMLTLQYRAADAFQLNGDIYLDTGRVVRGRYRGTVRCTEGTITLPRRREIGYEAGYGGSWRQAGGHAWALNTIEGRLYDE